MIKKRDKDIAREMLIAGKDVAAIVQTTDVPEATVQKIDEWLHRANSKIWFEVHHPEALARYHPNPVLPDSEPEPAPAAAVVPISTTINETSIANPTTTLAPQPPAPTFNMPNGNASSFVPPVPQQAEQSYYPPRPQMAVPTPPQQPQPRMMMVRENEENGTMQVLAAPRPIDIGSEPAAGKGRGNVNVTPMTLVWYDYMRSTGYDRDLPSFLEETTVGYFAKSGRKFVMIVDNGSG